MVVRIKQSGTELYKRTVAYDHGDARQNELIRAQWKPTPWMVDAFTGICDGARSQDMQRWCRENFGPEGSALHAQDGKWHRGWVTIDGWTWFGFATKNMLDLFISSWPTPEGVVHP